MSKILDKDGYINNGEIVSLAKEIDKIAKKEGLKESEIYFVGKTMPKYDREKAKAKGDAFTKRRAQIIKMKKRMPAAGSRMKMVVLLRLYKGFDDLEGADEFSKDIDAALSAINAHNKLAEKTIDSFKKEGAKTRAAAAKVFDKNIDSFTELLVGAGVKKSSIAIGQSMMGKSMLVKLPNGGYISVGKADEEKFEKAKESAKNPPQAAGGFGKAKTKGNGEDKKKSKSKDVEKDKKSSGKDKKSSLKAGKLGLKAKNGKVKRPLH